MGATVLTYLAIRLPWEEVVRPHYTPPLTRVTEPGAATSAASSDWIVDDGLIDAAGHRLSEGERSAILREVYGTSGSPGGESSLEQYLADHGLRHVTAHHPNDRFLDVPHAVGGTLPPLAVRSCD